MSDRIRSDEDIVLQLDCEAEFSDDLLSSAADEIRRLREETKPPRFIIAKVGTFADGAKMSAYQIYEAQKDWNYYYYVPYKGGDNSPVTLGKARQRLQEIEDAIRKEET